MKEGWTYKKFGDICYTISDGDWIEKKDQSDSGIRLIQTGNIGVGKFIPKNDSKKFINEETFKRLRCSEIFEGDILISRLPNPLGRSCILPNLGTRCITAVDCSILKINNKLVIPQYFIYYTQSNEYFSKIDSESSGTTRARITRKKIEETLIPVPPLPEQRAIVARLDSAFAQIDSLKANAEKQLSEARQLFQKALEEAMTPKEGWEVKTIDDVAYFRNGIAHEKEIDKGGKFVVINSKFVSSEGSIRKYTNEQLSPLYNDDIVMVMSDVPNGKTLAKCYIVECDGKYSLNQRICSFKTKGPVVRFLYYMINRNPFLLAYDNGENQTNLRKKQILECPVAYPKEISEQHSIVAHLDSLSSKVRALEEKLKRMQDECDALKQAMLREVFE